MPDIKEKLVELCEDLETLPCCATYEEQAEYLISNGVTIQEWISVEEGLPEPFVSVLGYCTECDPLPPVHEVYMNGFGLWCSAQVYGMGEATHWMPLPEPPKGEYGAP